MPTIPPSLLVVLALDRDQCHEPLFTEEAVALVQEMVRALDTQRNELDRIAITQCVR